MNISVVIPAYNAEKYIEATLDSIKRQTIKPYEVIVVDDGSRDKTVKVVKEWMTKHNYLVKIYPQPSNRGIGVARQLCFELASGDYVAYLSSDDCYDRHFIEKSLPYLNKRTATYTSYYQCNEKLSIKKTFVPPLFSRESIIEWALRKNMYVNFSCIILPKAFCKQIAFETELRHGEDLIYLLDSVAIGLNWHLINEPLLYYRIHDKMGSKTQPISEFDQLWNFIKNRLSLMDVPKKTVDRAYAKSHSLFYPSWHRRLLIRGYRFARLTKGYVVKICVAFVYLFLNLFSPKHTED